MTLCLPYEGTCILEPRVWQQVWPHTTTLNDPLGNCVLPVLIIQGSVGLEGLVHKGATLLPGGISNGKLRLPPGHFVFIMSKDQQVKGRVTILACTTGPDHQVKAGLLFPH